MVNYWNRLPRAFVESLEDTQHLPAHSPPPPAPIIPALSGAEQDNLQRSPTTSATLWFCVYSTIYTTLLPGI